MLLAERATALAHVTGTPDRVLRHARAAAEVLIADALR